MSRKENKSGRKTQYDSKVKPYLEEITDWCRNGLIEKEICMRLGVGLSTFNRYKTDNRELREALKSGKQHADFKVEDALFKKATGYDYDEVTYAVVEEKDPNTGNKVTKRIPDKIVKKHVRADTTAAIFWLKNRQPDKWRDKRDVEHSGGVTNTHKVDLSKLSVKDLEKLANLDKD